MKILGIEPYYGGSHRAFLDGWSVNSRHDWEIWELPAYKWKWRMRGAAVTFAKRFEKQKAESRYDLIFCSDMLNLAELKGVAGLGEDIPIVIYFHENQLTYPVQNEQQRDYQYVFTNMSSALAADCVWFNSGYHKANFLNALDDFLRRMPDNQPLWAIDMIRGKSFVYPPGIERIGGTNVPENKGKPLRILWAGRWEYDKNPEDFFTALKVLKEQGHDFRIDVIGERFRDYPEVFDRVKDYFAGNIVRWGYRENRDEYVQALKDADVFVSTAEHEFFGLSALEAASAGTAVILPDRLAYPEIFEKDKQGSEFFYDGTVEGLVEKLKRAMELKKVGDLKRLKRKAVEIARRYYWSEHAKKLDDGLEVVKCSKKNA